MDTRDICRRLGCSPVQLHAWVKQGLPVLRCWPFVRFDIDRVRRWLADNKITGWAKEDLHTTDVPVRVIFRELHRGALTPEQAEEIVTDLGWGWI